MARPKKSQFSGVLAKRIDDTEFNTALGAGPEDSTEFRKRVEARNLRLYQLRMNKIPELARQLGAPMKDFDFNTDAGLKLFYQYVLISLAIRVGIPGFLLTRPKWAPELVNYARIHGENRKFLGEPNPDLSICLEIVRTLDPDLARQGQASEATRRAKTLRNEVSKLRQRLKREAAERQAAQAKAKKLARKIAAKKIAYAAGGSSIH